MPRAISHLLLVAILSALAVTPAAGRQTTPVLNPKVVEFDPSADHAATTATGEPMVSRYELQLILLGASQPMTTVSLGKPAPQADGKIRVDFSALLVAWPLAHGTYEARVAAIGPSGAALSDPSNPFDFQPAVTPQTCTFALSPAARNLTAVGGASSVTLVASAATCGWTASSGASWLAVAPAGGTGSGSAVVTAAANTGAARTGTVTIGGQSYTVSQAAAPSCSFTIGASSASVGASASTGAVALTASAPTCAWSAATSVAWIAVAAASGTGSSSVSYSVAKNMNLVARAGAITVGGQVVTITQAAAVRPNAPRGLKIK